MIRFVSIYIYVYIYIYLILLRDTDLAAFLCIPLEQVCGEIYLHMEDTGSKAQELQRKGVLVAHSSGRFQLPYQVHI